jgi:hypothetical protein
MNKYGYDKNENIILLVKIYSISLKIKIILKNSTRFSKRIWNK